MELEFDKIQKMIVSKFEGVEPDLKCTLHKTSTPEKVMDENAQEKLLKAMEKAINGVYKMSEEIRKNKCTRYLSGTYTLQIYYPRTFTTKTAYDDISLIIKV